MPSAERALDELRVGDALRIGVLVASCIFRRSQDRSPFLLRHLDRPPGRLATDSINRKLSAGSLRAENLLLDVGVTNRRIFGLALALWKNKILFKYLPIYADLTCRLIAAMRGKSRRCSGARFG